MNDFGTTSSTENRQELFFAALAEFRELTKSGKAVELTEFCSQYPSIQKELSLAIGAIVGEGCPFDFTIAKSDIEQTLGPIPQLQILRQLEGQKLGNYLLRQKLGEGAMGVVYEAEEIILKKRVAVKITKTCELSELASLRLKQEATIVASLQHDHIVPVFGFEESHGYAFYVMQLIEGSSLNQFRDNPTNLLRKLHGLKPAKSEISSLQEMGNESPPEKLLSTPKNYRPIQIADGVARIGHTIAQALSYAHARGIQHLDVKPSNVLLDHHGKVWLTDFGLAEIHQSQSAERLWLGTIGYMSPEMLGLTAAGRLGTSDIYSLGATLYCLIAGKPTFLGELDAYRDWMLHGSVPSLRRLAPGVPRDLEAIITKAMDRDVNRRYQSAAEMATDLQCYLERRPITSQPLKLYDVAHKAIYRNRQMLTMVAAAAFLAMATFSYISWLYLQRAKTSESNYSELVTDLFRNLDESGNLRKNADPVAQYQRLKLITDFLDSRDQQGTLTDRERFLLAQFQYYTAKQLNDQRINFAEVESRLDRSVLLFNQHYKHSQDPIHRLDAARSMLFKAQCQLMDSDLTGIATTRQAVSMVEQLNRDYPNDPRFLDAVACYTRVLVDASLAVHDYDSADQAIDRSVAVSKELQALIPERWWFYAFNECLAQQSRTSLLCMKGDYENAIENSEQTCVLIDSVINAMKEAGENNESMTVCWLVTRNTCIESPLAMNQPEQALSEANLWLQRYRNYLEELPGSLHAREVALGVFLTKVQLMQKLGFPEFEIDQAIADFEAALPDDVQIRTRFMLYHPRATPADYSKAIEQLSLYQESGNVRITGYTTHLIALLLLDQVPEALKLSQAAEANNLVTLRFYKILLLLKSGKYYEAKEEYADTLSKAKASSFEERFAVAWIEREMQKAGIVLTETAVPPE